MAPLFQRKLIISLTSQLHTTRDMGGLTIRLAISIIAPSTPPFADARDRPSSSSTRFVWRAIAEPYCLDQLSNNIMSWLKGIAHSSRDDLQIRSQL
jgi:hypothetical protein